MNDWSELNNDDWTKIGKFDVMIVPDHFRIFPKNAAGESIPVQIRRVYILLRRKLPNGEGFIYFKHYLHQRKLYWSDSRKKGSCPRRHVRRELARMLFERDEKAAVQLIEQAEALL